MNHKKRGINTQKRTDPVRHFQKYISIETSQTHRQNVDKNTAKNTWSNTIK